MFVSPKLLATRNSCDRPAHILDPPFMDKLPPSLLRSDLDLCFVPPAGAVTTHAQSTAKPPADAHANIQRHKSVGSELSNGGTFIAKVLRVSFVCLTPMIPGFTDDQRLCRYASFHHSALVKSPFCGTRDNRDGAIQLGSSVFFRLVRDDFRSSNAGLAHA